ncbi:hypothetical protein CsSME_00020622 [Camellia sinensis var. sinensis]
MGKVEDQSVSSTVDSTVTWRSCVALCPGSRSGCSGDILDEIVAPTIKVEIKDLQPLDGSNKTKVVFAVVPAEKNSRVSSTVQSLVRDTFESLVTNQHPLHCQRMLSCVVRGEFLLVQLFSQVYL